jgi:8-oxo-dGTP pyrophosphatase MutT (NUDIX family)
MGRRHSNHAFLPGKYVFPGGRVDTADCRLRPAADLDPAVAEKLMVKMRGRPSLARARGLAMAAVRETFEEVGLIVGTDPPASARAPARRHGRLS